MKIELTYLDPAALDKGRNVEKTLTVDGEYAPDTGDQLTLDPLSGAMTVTDRRFLVVRGKIEARLRLR